MAVHLRRADDLYLARLRIGVDEKVRFPGVAEPVTGFWHLHTMGMRPPSESTGIVLDVTALGFVATGAWRVQCPFCPSSQFGHPERQDRFCCCDCGNADVDGQWVRVEWPADAAELEAALLVRRNPTVMHWLPHESVEHLHAENVEHKVVPLGQVPKDRRKLVKALVEATHEVEAAHVIMPGAIVHPDSEWHPGRAVEVLRALGANFDEDDVRLALHVYGRGR